MTKINKYKLKEEYAGYLNKFIDRLNSSDKKIVNNGHNADRNKD